ncbi:hypothetical protein HAX54_036157 [Datura stramonium]|uniref:Uncharacterized protein n=1 Tax=Datura stramonium TaxID=4076 RepID=A0ABS8SGV5_DATST|nr:hypothetical protein [Datura stramonium]
MVEGGRNGAMTDGGCRLKKMARYARRLRPSNGVVDEKRRGRRVWFRFWWCVDGEDRGRGRCGGFWFDILPKKRIEEGGVVVSDSIFRWKRGEKREVVAALELVSLQRIHENLSD